MKSVGSAARWTVASSGWAALLDVAGDLGVDTAATYVCPWDPSGIPKSLPHIGEDSAALLLLRVGEKGGYLFRVHRTASGFDICGGYGNSLGEAESADDVLAFMLHASGLSAAREWADFSAEMDRRTLD